MLSVNVDNEKLCISRLTISNIALKAKRCSSDCIQYQQS